MIVLDVEESKNVRVSAHRVKTTRGSRDTHGAHGRTGTRITQTNLTTIQTHEHTRARTTARPYVRASAADSTAAAPEPNAPKRYRYRY